MTTIDAKAMEIMDAIEEIKQSSCSPLCHELIAAALLAVRNETIEEIAKEVENRGSYKSLSLVIESFGPRAGEVQDRGRVSVKEPFKSLAVEILALKATTG